jgi:hypothetical protein
MVHLELMGFKANCTLVSLDGMHISNIYPYDNIF